MNPTLLSRLHAAASLVFKSGAPFPFNKIMPYDALGGERMYHAYEQSTWVNRAIKKIAGPIAAVDLRFTRNGQLLQDDELEAFWRNPGVGLSRADFIEATVSWLKLQGEAFWILDDSWLGSSFGHGGDRREMAPLLMARPDRMHHIVKNGDLAGWEYVDGANRRSLLLPEQVVQMKMWNPYSDWRGLSELRPCRDAAEADFLAGKFNLNLMRNNGDQGVYVIAKNGVPTDTQRQQLIDQIREKREMAQRGVFKPVFLTGDITIEDPKIRVPDGDFNATRLQNRHEIFIAMGVPASMADVKASYSIGSASDWFLLISETCIPTGVKICAAIDEVVRQQRGPGISAALDWDEHPVIQAVRRERADTAQKYFQMGVPMQMLNEYLNLGMAAYPGWERGYLPFNVAPVEGKVLPEGAANWAEPMDDTIALMRGALAVSRGKTPLGLAGGEMTETTETTKRAETTDDRLGTELGQWRELMAQRREMTKAFASRLNRELMKARAEALRRLERDGQGGKPFDLTAFGASLAAALRPVTLSALQTAGEQFFAEVGHTGNFALPRERAGEFLKWREECWGALAERIYGEAEEASEMAPEGGAAEAVRAVFNDLAKNLATGAAADEMGAVYGLARDAAMEQAGIRRKRWLSSGHAETRADHRKANGQTVSSDEMFVVGGESLRHPCDEKGAAANVRNCQCVAVVGAEPHKALEKSAPAAKPNRLVRLIHPEVRIVDARRGIVDYIASDESIDSYREIIRAAGWRFTHFQKNAPFVDSHDYSTIGKCLGKVIDFRVEGSQLIERVQWAVDVPENLLAQIGWRMTEAGYLKAVSVGFFPIKYLTPNSGEAWAAQLRELGLPADAAVRTIYTEQEQVELSCCVVGSNANALAKAYKAGAINDADIETLSHEYSESENVRAAAFPALAARTREQARTEFLEKLQNAMKQGQL
jgi:Phage portal protein